jgi:hypothetical protein
MTAPSTVATARVASRAARAIDAAVGEQFGKFGRPLISLPNGLGVDHPEHGHVGVAPNELTSLEWCDAFGTPWHEHVPARVEPVSQDHVA